MEHNRELIKTMKKTGAKIMPRSSIYEINPYYEWMKWLEYEPDFEINGLEKQKENYEKLSMVDSYVLHELLKISFEKNMSDLKNQIESELKDNAYMARKKFILCF